MFFFDSKNDKDLDFFCKCVRDGFQLIQFEDIANLLIFKNIKCKYFRGDNSSKKDNSVRSTISLPDGTDIFGNITNQNVKLYADREAENVVKQKSDTRVKDCVSIYLDDYKLSHDESESILVIILEEVLKHKLFYVEKLNELIKKDIVLGLYSAS